VSATARTSKEANLRQERVGKLIPLLAALLLAGPLGASQPARSESSLAEKVEAAIGSLPRYGPFDVISFEVTGDIVTLGGEVYFAPLKKETEKAVAAVPGVARVVNSIDILPLSFEDDRLRRAVFLTIYRDNFLTKYGTPVAAFRRGARGQGRATWGFGPHRALGFEPSGNYAIHVVVKGGRVTLSGLVDNAVDRDKAAFDARSVFGVMAVENRIEVNGRTPAA
jgi:hyperosmotically inducible protein